MKAALFDDVVGHSDYELTLSAPGRLLFKILLVRCGTVFFADESAKSLEDSIAAIASVDQRFLFACAEWCLIVSGAFPS